MIPYERDLPVCLSINSLVDSAPVLTDPKHMRYTGPGLNALSSQIERSYASIEVCSRRALFVS